MRRHLHLVAPVCPRDPAGFAQVVGGGSQGVGYATDQIAVPVAVEIHGDARVGARHELRLAEGAGPGAGDLGGTQVTLLQQLEGGEEFAAEECLAPPMAGQGGQRGEQRTLAGDAAEIALHAPDGDHRVLVHLVALGDAFQQVVMLRQHGPAIGHPLLVHQPGEVVPDRRDEFRLRVEQVQHAEVGLQVLRIALVGDGVHTLGASLRLQPRQAVAEGVRGGRLGEEKGGAEKQNREGSNEQHGPVLDAGGGPSREGGLPALTESR
ncbi:hypothetical protein D9M71_207210 [compost metagenome]